MPSIGKRLVWAWNAFTNKDDNYALNYSQLSSSFRPDRTPISIANKQTIISSIYNRLANDAASIDINHVSLDENGRYKETMDSTLNLALTLEANIDQSGREMLWDSYMSMFENGSLCIVPVDKSDDNGDILSLRSGKIVQWYPDKVLINLYNDRTGYFEDVLLDKREVAISENPFYSIMNEPNSTFKRLIHKINLLDSVDEQSGSGKLDLIIQLPYVVKTPTRKEQAENRRKDIETQLNGSKYGIAYTDATEKIVQLNRSLDNNLLKQVEYLTKMLFSQLGLTEEILNGTANPEVMENYYNRTIEPIVTAAVSAMRRKFIPLEKIKEESIVSFRDPFRLIPPDKIADMSDKLTRNEILSTNEVRGLIGFKPSSQPGADELRNKNLNRSNQEIQDTEDPDEDIDET